MDLLLALISAASKEYEIKGDHKLKTLKAAGISFEPVREGIRYSALHESPGLWVK